MIGSKERVILLNGWILPIGEAASGRVCTQSAKQACFLKIILLPQCLLTFFFDIFCWTSHCLSRYTMICMRWEEVINYCVYSKKNIIFNRLYLSL